MVKEETKKTTTTKSTTTKKNTTATKSTAAKKTATTKKSTTAKSTTTKKPAVKKVVKTPLTEVLDEFSLEEAKSTTNVENAEQIEKIETDALLKKKNVIKPVVIDSETSDILKQIKVQEIANKPKEITSEETDKQTVEEEIVVEAGVERYLNTDIAIGLTEEQVNLRNTQGLINDAGDDKGKSIFEIIISNFLTLFNILYLIITIIIIILQQYTSLIFLLAVIPNIIIGIVQEIKSKLTVDKMKILAAPKAIVMRDGVKKEIATKEVVLDEIVIYSSGKQICADSIIIDGNVEVNESLLTGEADSIPKAPGARLLSGSFITSGTCIARAERVGKDCYISKMSADAKKYAPPKSELLKTLKSVIRLISLILLPIAILYILSHMASFDNFWENFKDAFSNNIGTVSYITLAMIPAGLFLLTSVALFVGVGRLAKNNTLVQELYCIEMLARVDVLCLDKTGTITDGTMRVCDCVEINNHTDYTIREIVGSMMYAFEETNPTSDALIKYFDKNEVITATEVIPFSSKRKYSAVSFGKEGTFIIGAPDFVIKENYEKINSKVTRFSNQGCRVLILGYLNGKIKNEELPKNVRPLALIVIQDHIRDDAADTISFFKQNNVDIKVISGDNPETVSKIANRVGVENAHRYINLNGLTDDEIREKVFDYAVFGRVTPSQKKIIVQALKANGKTVAMTGDGVNDIPALKEADCSVAMASGSEATRYVSHLVLMDSNFSSMPKVVMEGRRVINNIQKTSALYLTKNLFALLIAIMYIIIGFVSIDNKTLTNTEFPFRPENLVLIESVILAFATFCLAIQPNTDIVRGKFINNVFKQIIPGAVTILLFQLIIFFLQSIKINDNYLFDALRNNPEVFKTMAAFLTTIIMVFVLFAACKPFNWYRKLVFGVVVVVMALAIFIPQTRSFIKFGFDGFASTEWLLMIILVQAVYPAMLVVKYVLGLLHIIPKTSKEK